MNEFCETIIIGAGQAGLSASYYLTQLGLEHVVLEQQRVGTSWRTKRWDSLRMVTPNWTLQLPGYGYRGPDPDGFLGLDEVIAYLDEYAAFVNPPVRCGVRVNTVTPNADGGYRVHTDQGCIEAINVVVATGFYQRPKIPAFAQNLPPQIEQIHTSGYRNPSQLPPILSLTFMLVRMSRSLDKEMQNENVNQFLDNAQLGINRDAWSGLPASTAI